MKSAVQFLGVVTTLFIILISSSGCANIVPPGGGPRDSIPPVLVSATPPDSSKNVRPSRITLTFDEYVDQLQNVMENVIISPTLPNIPQIDARLRTINIRLRDTLEPNTTYSINFGNAIRDVNEGNVLENFTYVFSTGATIDSFSLSGKAILAETGKVDSTLIAILHADLSDTAVITKRPRYYSRLKGDGSFQFNNLPAARFNVFILSGNSFARQYNDSTLMFAFLDSAVTVSANTQPVLLYAYEEAKRENKPSTTSGNTRSTDRRLRYATNLEGGTKDVHTPLLLEFAKKLTTFDSTRIILADTNYNPVSNYSVVLDSTRTKMSITHSWPLETTFKLLLPKDALADVDRNTLPRNDTITFTTKRAEDYGQVLIRLNNLDLSRNPVLQIVQNNTIVQSVPMSGREWRNNLFKPGEYELRILFDTNKNGVWDPGNYRLKKQPEIVRALDMKLSVRANWENEEEITLAGQ